MRTVIQTAKRALRSLLDFEPFGPIDHHAYHMRSYR